MTGGGAGDSQNSLGGARGSRPAPPSTRKKITAKKNRVKNMHHVIIFSRSIHASYNDALSLTILTPSGEFGGCLNYVISVVKTFFYVEETSNPLDRVGEGQQQA